MRCVEVARLLTMRAADGPRDWALLDVRERGEADAGHIYGATSLPRRQLEFRIADLVPARQTELVIYDDGDGRAALAAATLQRFGYERASVLEGGLAAWRAGGGAVISGTNVPSKAFGERVHVDEHPKAITAADLRRRVASGESLIICDVRTPEEYDEAHLPGGHMAPSFDFVLNALDLSRKFDTVVVNCAGRTRSIIAARTLQVLGIDNGCALENGTSGWLLEGWELERGTTRRIDEPTAESVAEIAARADSLAAEAGVGLISATEFAGRLARRGSANVYACDVRSLQAFRTGHIPGTVTLPGGQAIQRADDFFSVPAGEILLADDGDARSALTGYWLRRMGYPTVLRIDGGLPAWRAMGGQIETGRPRAEPLGLAEARKQVRMMEATDLVSRPDASRAMRIIDVGPSRQYASEHIPASLWLPRGWLELRCEQLVDRAAPVLCVAREEAQAVLAAAALGEQGYKDVAALRGGTKSWREAGGTLEAGEPVQQYGGEDYVLPPYLKGKEAMTQYLKWEIELTDHADIVAHGRL